MLQKIYKANLLLIKNFNSLIINNNYRYSSNTTSNISSYKHLEIEKKWQTYWENNSTFVTSRRIGHKKKYILDMFPYPSGSGLHVGHPEGYTATDIMSRYYRMNDFDVLHPMGWDSFGLPAEQHAINTGTHPAITTGENILNFKRQLKSLGFSYDWSRELATTDDNYVRWTQWIFLKLFHNGLASQGEKSVNWCPALGTVLANEEIINGLSERGDHPIVRMPLRQWILNITKYADKLENGLADINWPEGTMAAQKSWIGKSIGASIKFKINCVVNNNNRYLNSETDYEIEVFTTRADTIMGVSYLVLAPEHSLVPIVTTQKQRVEVDTYISKIAGRSDLERTSTGIEKGKTGVNTGAFAIHPFTGENIPIWIADYVLGGYGTGAVMAVPAHDERDFEFATIYNLPIKRVLNSIEDPNKSKQENELDNKLPMIKHGITCNSGDDINNTNTIDCINIIIKKLQITNSGGEKITYRLRDWVFSRQRYWGEPIPIYFPVEILTSDGIGSPIDGVEHRIDYNTPIAVDDCDLPLKLPSMVDFHPGDDPQGCLSRAIEWRYFQKNNKWYARETNTMPQWAGSCWYYLRFADPHNSDNLIGKEAESWLPVDLYVGGQEHAVLHLLYARFWHKFLYDIGIINHSEPFVKLVHQGMILGSDGEKMSKSRGNVINPDDIVKEYGADALRLYEMFMGPLEAVKPWQTNQLPGVVRFRDRVYNLVCNSNITNKEPTDELLRDMNKTIQKVTNDIEKLSFNTAISNMMIYSNTLNNYKNNNDSIPKKAIEVLILLLSPFAPHVSEESWLLLGHNKTLAYHSWPEFDEKLCIDNTATIAIQINGKVRAKLEMEIDLIQENAVELAIQQDNVQKYITGKELKKVIYIPGKIINLIY